MDARYRSAIGTTLLISFVILTALAARSSAQTTVPGDPNALSQHQAVYKVDSVEFKLAPGEGMEYKYRMDKGGSLVYTWKASGPVEFDMHSEADNAPKGTAESFATGTADQGHGSYKAPFPGIHGWFWQNKGQQEVSLKITSAGFYASAMEFRKNVRQPYELKDVQP